jgi:hypothetical protein
MELLSQNVVVENLLIEISVHDLSFRMGFPEGVEPSNHLYVNLTAKDHSGARVWSTPLLTTNGKVKAFSSLDEALKEARARLLVAETNKPETLTNATAE